MIVADQISAEYLAGCAERKQYLREKLEDLSEIDNIQAATQLAALREAQSPRNTQPEVVSEARLSPKMRFPNQIGLLELLHTGRPRLKRPLGPRPTQLAKVLEDIRQLKELVPPKNENQSSVDHKLGRRALCLVGAENDAAGITNAISQVHVSIREIFCDSCSVRRLCDSPLNASSNRPASRELEDTVLFASSEVIENAVDL